MWKLPQNWEFLLAAFIGVYFALFYYVFPGDDEAFHLGKYLTVLSEEQINSMYSNSIKNLSTSKFAYVQYATSVVYLNLAIINYIHLKKSSKISNFVILYNEDLSKTDLKFNGLQDQALSNGIELVPISVIGTEQSKNSEWELSFTKLHAFNSVAYERIVFFDADSILTDVQVGDDGKFVNNYGNLDELFSIPMDIDIALPQAYWLFDPKSSKNKPPKELQLNFMASHVMVIKPNATTFQEVGEYVYNPFSWRILHRNRLIQDGDFDMEVLNRYIKNKLDSQVTDSRKGRETKKTIKIGILPHTVYGVITGEFKHINHAKYLAEPQSLQFIKPNDISTTWSALDCLKLAKLFHYSDAPIHKPWEGPLENSEYYNIERIYCGDPQTFQQKEFEREYPMYKPRLTDDCDSVDAWNWVRAEFEDYRKGKWLV